MDVDYAKQALASQPFGVLLGARVVEFGDGSAAIELDIRDELQRPM